MPSTPEIVDSIRRIAESGQGLSAMDLSRIQDLVEMAEPAGLVSAFLDDSTAAGRWARGHAHKRLGSAAEALAAIESMPELAWGDGRAVRWLAIAGLRGDCGRSDAPLALRQAVACCSSVRLLQQADRVLRKLKKSGLIQGLRGYRVAILSTFTADLLPQLLRPLLFASGVEAEFWVAPFQQVHQTLLGDNPALAAFQPDLVMLANDWRAVGENTSADEYLSGLETLWGVARNKHSAAVMQFNCEVPSLDPMGRLRVQSPRQKTLSEINRRLWVAEGVQPGVFVLDVDGIASDYGKARWADPAAWEMGRLYPATDALPLLSRQIVALVRAILGLSSKCLVLDLDNTLWGGVIGEDGVAGIQLGGTGKGAAFVEFQKYVKGLQQRGVLLAVCSKNNMEDALQPFREHPEMILKETDIAVFRANWEGKESNLREIASTINIGLDSLVFVDDNPAERERIRQELPMVEVPEMPRDPACYSAVLHETLRFESLAVTKEDLLRSESIRTNVQRETLAKESGGAEAYLFGLQMVLTVQPFTEIDLTRIVQLFNKTNQFNLTTRRITDVQAREWMASPEAYTLSIRLKDRFGEFGLTGLMVAVVEPPGDVMRITDWLMSCRILGRGVEQCMLALVAAEARRRGCRALIGQYLPTPKNGMVADLYERFGFAKGQGEGEFQLDLAAGSLVVPDYLSLDDQLVEA